MDGRGILRQTRPAAAPPHARDPVLPRAASKAVLQPDAVEIDSGVALLDAAIRMMLEALADIERLFRAEAVAHPKVVAELEMARKALVAGVRARQQVEADRGFTIKPREAVGLNAKDRRQPDFGDVAVLSRSDVIAVPLRERGFPVAAQVSVRTLEPACGPVPLHADLPPVHALACAQFERHSAHAPGGRTSQDHQGGGKPR